MNVRDEDHCQRPIRVAVVGSRSFTNYRLLCDTLDVLCQEYHVTALVSGGAKGADQLAERYARENQLEIEVLRPQWRDSEGRYDRAAGLRRNTDIVERANCVVAFWDGISTGTRDSLRKARALGREVRQIDF